VQVDSQGEPVAAMQDGTPAEDLPWGMRFILQAVARDDPKQVRRLKQTLLEAKPHRSKWYDPNRPGQAELYEALERILLELKAFSPHCLPFLHRVSKKEVPDYHLIIKRPMDLSAMLKKLKSHEYKSKVDFVADLNLIYDNCMTYNTAIDSPLRAAVRLLKEKWLLLLNKVPDVSVRFVPDVSGDLLRSDEIDHALEEDLKVVSSESSGLDMDYNPYDDNVDDLLDEPMTEDTGSSQPQAFPSRSPELMRSFRKTQQMPLEGADWALFANAFPDTWSLDGRLPAVSKARFSEEFSRRGIEEHLECMSLHAKLQAAPIPKIDRSNLSCVGRIDSPQASRKSTLKLAALILAAHGCDSTFLQLVNQCFRCISDCAVYYQGPFGEYFEGSC
jgi:hypothetical protein